LGKTTSEAVGEAGINGHSSASRRIAFVEEEGSAAAELADSRKSSA